MHVAIALAAFLAAPAPTLAARHLADPDSALANLNLSGSMWLGIEAVADDAGEPWLEVRMSAGAARPKANAWGALATGLEHFYYRLSVDDAGGLADGLDAWCTQPHSLSIYSSTGVSGMAFTGNAWNPVYEPLVIVQGAYWIPLERGIIHGELGTALTRDDAKMLAKELRVWAESPAVGGGFLFQRGVQ